MQALIIQEEQPTSVYTGRIWLKLSTMSAHMRMGASWVPIASGTITPIIEFKTITIFINDVDVTDMLVTGSLSIEDILTSEVNTCSFQLDDETGLHKPVVGQDVQVYYKQTSSSMPILIFGGRITDMPQSKISIQKYTYGVNCSDYSQDLQRNQVVKTYTGQTAGYIIKDIVNTYAQNLGTFHVDDGLVVEYIAFNYKFPFECIQEIAELTGYDWYVDYEKNVNFFLPSSRPAPYSLTDNLADGEYLGLEISIDKSSLKNKQIVRGGYQFSQLFTEEQVADGTQLAFNLKYEPYTPVSVYVDAGAGYVAHTLGIDNVDTSGKDFVVNVTEKNIKNLDHAVLSAGQKIKITYKYKMPILAQIEDNNSIALMKKYEGGDGIYEGELIIDETIETIGAAKQRALAELEMYSNPLIEGNFITTQYGYKSGQLLTVNIPSRGINATYIIQSVAITSLGNGLIEYEITFASKLKGLTDFLIYLFDNGKKIFERTDELLSVVKPLSDGFTLTDSVPTESRRDVVTHPFVYSNDAGTTPDKGQYNLAQYG